MLGNYFATCQTTATDLLGKTRGIKKLPRDLGSWVLEVQFLVLRLGARCRASAVRNF
jgi:hypothetical protein